MALSDLRRSQKPIWIYERQAMNEKLKLVFAPGCFDNFDGTEEELAAMIADIHQMVEDGTLMEKSTRLSPEEEAEIIEIVKSRSLRQ